MVSLFGLKLGADKKNNKRPTERQRKVKEANELSPNPLADLPFPPPRPGTSNSHRPPGGRSPYGQPGGSCSLVDLRPPASIQPFTTEPTSQEAPRPGQLLQAGTWPRGVTVKVSAAPGHARHGSSASMSFGSTPTASLPPIARLDAPARRQRLDRPKTPDVLQLPRDAAAAAMQAPPRSPLGQFEFNLRKQHSASPVVSLVEPFEDRSIVPVIEDPAYGRPSSPAPRKALPPTPLRPPTGSSNNKQPLARLKAPSNLREVRSRHSGIVGEDDSISPIMSKSPPPLADADALVKPPPGPAAAAVAPRSSPVRQAAPTLNVGRRRSIERDFGNTGVPVFTDNDTPSTAHADPQLVAQRSPLGSKNPWARSASPSRRGTGPEGESRPLPRNGPIGRGYPGGPPTGSLASAPQQRPADISPSARTGGSPETKPPGDRVLPHTGPPGPPRGLHDVPSALRIGPDQFPSRDQSPILGSDPERDGPCLEAGPGPSFEASHHGQILHPSPFPAPLGTAAAPTHARPREFFPMSPSSSSIDSPCPSPLSIGNALRPPPPPSRAPPARRNFSAPGLQPIQTQGPRAAQAPSAACDSPSSGSDEAAPKRRGDDMSHIEGEGRCSFTSSIYSSDSSASTPGRDPSGPMRGQRVIEPAGTELAKLMQFDFGFGS